MHMLIIQIGPDEVFPQTFHFPSMALKEAFLEGLDLAIEAFPGEVTKSDWRATTFGYKDELLAYVASGVQAGEGFSSYEVLFETCSIPSFGTNRVKRSSVFSCDNNILR